MPTTTQRGYGAKHQALRREWAPLVDAGLVDCWRCGRHITPGTEWDLGHDDVDRAVTHGPEHQTCNRGTNRRGRPRNRRTNPQPLPIRPPIPAELRYRPCVICGHVYKARYLEQRACSRACGEEVRRRNRSATPPKPQRRQPRCSECGQQFSRNSNRQVTCGPDCARRRQARVQGRGGPRTYTCSKCGGEHEQPGQGRPRTTCDACRTPGGWRDVAHRRSGTARTPPPTIRQPPTAARW